MRPYTKLDKSLEKLICNSTFDLSYTEARILVYINSKAEGEKNRYIKIPLLEIANETDMSESVAAVTLMFLKNKNIIICKLGGLAINFNHIERLVNKQ